MNYFLQLLLETHGTALQQKFAKQHTIKITDQFHQKLYPDLLK